MARYEYTSEVRRVIAAANKEAVRLNHGAVGTEHMLLAALRESATTDLLRAWGVTPEEVQRAIESRVKPGEVESDGSRPLAPDARQALGSAMAAGRAEGGTVTLAHLLSGVIAEGLAAAIVREVRESPTVTAGNPLHIPPELPQSIVELDDESTMPLTEQIVAQITEAVAIGRLVPGERLPAVRQLADILQIAPGTVARAYSELERRNIVATDRARGTRISFELGSSNVARSDTSKLSAAFRPIVVDAFHAGAGSVEVRAALEEAMRDIYH
jgi:GntR family transcriptional regulator